MRYTQNGRALVDGGVSPLGWSTLGTYLLCARQGALREFTRRAGGLTLPRPAPTLGTLVHAGLAQHYAQRRGAQINGITNWADASEAIEHEARQGMAALAAANLPKTQYTDGVKVWADAAKKAQVLVLQHENRWARLEHRWIIRAVETVVTFALSGVEFTARLDLVIEDEHGKIYIIDHKTAGVWGYTQRLGYALSGQILAFQLCGPALLRGAMAGKTWGGVILNIIGTGTSATFLREPPMHAPEGLRTFPQTVAKAAEIRTEALKQDPQDVPGAYHEKACRTPYGLCDFIDRCRVGTETQEEPC